MIGDLLGDFRRLCVNFVGRGALLVLKFLVGGLDLHVTVNRCIMFAGTYLLLTVKIGNGRQRAESVPESIQHVWKNESKNCAQQIGQTVLGSFNY